MNQKSYVKAVAKRLTCSKERRDEFVRDLESDIAAALAGGETWEQVERRMGDPRQTARELNEELPERELAAGKKRKRTKAIAVSAAAVIVLFAVIAGATWWATPHQGEVEQLGDSDPMVVLARETVTSFDAGEYDAVRALASEEAADALTDEVFTQVRAAVAQGDWGSFVSFGSAYRAKITNMGESMEVVQLVAVFEKTAVTFTFPIDDDMKLAGFYVK